MNTDLDSLHKPSEGCNPEEIEGLFSDLKKEVLLHKAVGLAAVQTGIYKRAFVYFGGTGELFTDDEWVGVANPEIIEASPETILHTEGCLSIPDKRFVVLRHIWLRVRDHQGEYMIYDYDAIVWQHEFDHINGVVIADKHIETAGVERNDTCPCGSGKKFKKCHLPTMDQVPNTE